MEILDLKWNSGSDMEIPDLIWIFWNMYGNSGSDMEKPYLKW
jgi:hypothetical protein